MASRLLAFSDRQREAMGYRTLAELLELIEAGNRIPDVFSVLISRHVAVGTGNTFYPSVVLECREDASLRLGDGNVFTPGCFIRAESGTVRIGSGNLFGDGGFTLRTDGRDAVVTIGDRGRYINGVALTGTNTLGTGSQVIGPIRVQNCHLDDGGDHASPDPDTRGGVLKGYGLARGLRVPQGQVIAGNGAFSRQDMKPQSFYHPKEKR